MLYKINDIPLRYKFLLIYFLCVLIPILTINLLFFHQNSAHVRIREEDNVRKSFERATGELLAMIEESVELSLSISADASLYEALDRTYPTPAEFYETYNNVLRDKLKRYVYAYSNISEIAVYTANPTIENGGNYHRLSDDPFFSALFDRLERSGENFMVVAYIDTSLLTPTKRISVISRMDMFRLYSDYEKYLEIDLNIGKIASILDREKDIVLLRLIDDENRIVVSGLPSETQSLQMVGFVEPKNAMVMTLGETGFAKGWKVVGIPDDRRIEALMSNARRFVLWLTVATTVIPTLLIFVILRSYHDRIQKLARHMKKIKNGQFELIELREDRDEIGGLIRSFNTMAGKINSLINDVYKLEIRQKSLELERVRAEINMLQSQMNPHFLFNTLNALYVVCTKRGYLEATEIVRNLSLLLRRMISFTDDLVPLSEEIHFTEMYLRIEKFRFGDRFNYEFQIDPQAASCLVPKMSIQPLVENACKHGLQMAKGAGKISVEARLTDRELEIYVRDDGVGMNRDALERLLSSLKSDDYGHGHVGIRNVYRRLELFYGENIRFLAQSEPGKGTTIGFGIPIERLEVIAST